MQTGSISLAGMKRRMETATAPEPSVQAKYRSVRAFLGGKAAPLTGEQLADFTLCKAVTE